MIGIELLYLAPTKSRSHLSAKESFPVLDHQMPQLLKWFS